MEEPRTLKDLLEDGINRKETSVKEISALSGVPERFVNGFLGEITALPAAPYVRGYLLKIAKILDMDGKEIWRIYEHENKPRSSGSFDRLPLNRFAGKRNFNKKTTAGVLLGLIILAYAAFNIQRFWNAPVLTFTNPAENILKTADAFVVFQGRVDNPEHTVSINGASVFVDETGEFQKELVLDNGTNTFEIVAKKFLGRETRIIKQVI